MDTIKVGDHYISKRDGEFAKAPVGFSLHHVTKGEIWTVIKANSSQIMSGSEAVESGTVVMENHGVVIALSKSEFDATFDLVN